MSKAYWLIIYVCILHFGPLLNIFGMLPGGRVYAVTTVANLIAAYFTLDYLGTASKARGKSLTPLDMLVTGYLVWSALSIILYFQANNPTALEGYWYGTHTFTLPICAYFIAKHLTSAQLMKVLRFVVYTNAFAMLIGIYLFSARPDYYTEFMRDATNRMGDLEDWQIYNRMQSYLGSTAVGIVSALSIVLIRITNPSVIFAFSGVALFASSVLLSRQRGGMVGAAVALIYFLVFHKGRRLMGIVVIGLGSLLAALMLTTVDNQHEGVVDNIFSRFTEVTYVFDEHRSGYTVVWDYITDFPFGVGVGATGASSDGLQDRGKVVDANFMRILADLGIQGLALFIVVIVAAGLSALKRKDRLGWISVLVIYVVVALGTNTLDSHYVSQLFWIFLATMDTPEVQPEAVQITVLADEPLSGEPAPSSA